MHNIKLIINRSAVTLSFELFLGNIQVVTLLDIFFTDDIGREKENNLDTNLLLTCKRETILLS